METSFDDLLWEYDLAWRAYTSIAARTSYHDPLTCAAALRRDAAREALLNAHRDTRPAELQPDGR